MRKITSTEAKAKLNAVLADVAESGRPITVTSRGQAVAVISPVSPRTREFGQLPGLRIAADFDAPLPEGELAEWEGTS